MIVLLFRKVKTYMVYYSIQYKYTFIIGYNMIEFELRILIKLSFSQTIIIYINSRNNVNVIIDGR